MRVFLASILAAVVFGCGGTYCAQPHATFERHVAYTTDGARIKPKLGLAADDQLNQGHQAGGHRRAEHQRHERGDCRRGDPAKCPGALALAVRRFRRRSRIRPASRQPSNAALTAIDRLRGQSTKLA